MQVAAGLSFVEVARDAESACDADFRYRALLGETAWNQLPPAIRRRFSKRLCSGSATIYSGRTTEMRASRACQILARTLRFAGSPLPVNVSIGEASIVIVTPDTESNGQVWTRVYARRHTIPQVIHSTKRFSGPTGLEEDIGYGLSIALDVSAEDKAIVFRSVAYLFSILGRSFTIPDFLTPGRLVVSHREVAPDSFVFMLHLEHRVFGVLMHQEILFSEASP